jgi:ech hydrogenase subunit C/membrane-bound hydrogenase subunit mbhJ
VGIRLQIITRSLWIYPVVAGGCNGCQIEILACLSPAYDLERFGVRLASRVPQSDALVVSGSMTQRNVKRMKRLLQEMPDPGIVVAVGTCSLGQGIFEGSALISKPADAVLPVQLYIPGCPPKPEAVIAGLGKLVKIIRQNPDR